MSAPFQIRRPSTPAGYRRVIQDLVELWPWRQEGVADEDLPRVMASRVDPGDVDRKCRRFLTAWNAYAENDFFFFARFCTTTADRIHPRYGVQLDRPRLDIPNRYFLFEFYREVERRFLTLGDDGKPLLHRTWIYRSRRSFKTTCWKDFSLWLCHRVAGFAMMIYSRIADPMAYDRLKNIRLEAESNGLLHMMRPDLYWGAGFRGSEAELRNAVRTEAHKAGVEWGAAELTLKRPDVASGATRADPTFRANGIQGGLHTGSGADVRCFDDCVDRKNATGDMAMDTFAAFRDAVKITNPNAGPGAFDVWIGTDWDGETPYRMAVEDGLIRTVWKQGAINYEMPNPENADIAMHPRGGTPIFFDEEELRDQLPRLSSVDARADYARQYLCETQLAQRQGLNIGDLCYYDKPPMAMAAGCPLVILEDPGGSGYHHSAKHRISDTCWGVWALLPGGSFALVEIALDIISPSERAEQIVRAHAKWEGAGFQIQQTRLEQPGQTADGETLAATQARLKHYFTVYTVPRGGPNELSKIERIYSQFEPLISNRRLYFPRSMPIKYHGKVENFITILTRIVEDFPNTTRMDFFDMAALLAEPVGRKVYAYRGGMQPQEVKGGLPSLLHPTSKPRSDNSTRASRIKPENRWFTIGLPRSRRAA